MKKILVLILALQILFISGCGGKEIDDMAFVVAVGIDKGETGYDYTFAIGDPKSIGGGGKGAQGGDSNVLVLKKQSGENIFSAGDAVGAGTGQKVNFSHCELVVMSDEIAKGGIYNFSDALMRHLNQRPKFVPAVCSSSAFETLKNIKSEFEGNPERHLKKILEDKSSPVSSEIDGIDFLCQTKNIHSGCAVPFVSAEDNITVNKMSVFKSGYLVGEFEDIYAYKLIMGNAKDITVDVPGGSVIVNQRKKPKISVKSEEEPIINIQIPINCTLSSLWHGEDKNEVLQKAQKTLNGKVTALCELSSKEMGTDFFGFEQFVRKNFLTWEDFEKYNWSEKYKQAQFNVEVKIIPEKTGLIKGDL